MSLLYKIVSSNLLRRIILVIGIVCLGIAIYNFADIVETCKHWQEKAWVLWTQAQADYVSGKSSEVPGVPQDWWSQNPWMISIYVWSAVLKNWILTIIGIVSGIYNSFHYVQKRRYRALLKRGASMVTKV